MWSLSRIETIVRTVLTFTKERKMYAIASFFERYTNTIMNASS